MGMASYEQVRGFTNDARVLCDEGMTRDVAI